jgi:hypothetical protein
MSELAKRSEAALGRIVGHECNTCAHTACGDNDATGSNHPCWRCGDGENWHPDAALVGELLALIPAKEEPAPSPVGGPTNEQLAAIAKMALAVLRVEQACEADGEAPGAAGMLARNLVDVTAALRAERAGRSADVTPEVIARLCAAPWEEEKP